MDCDTHGLYRAQQSLPEVRADHANTRLLLKDFDKKLLELLDHSDASETDPSIWNNVMISCGEQIGLLIQRLQKLKDDVHSNGSLLLAEAVVREF